MANVPVEDTLANVELFSDLNREDLARLGKSCVTREFKQGDIIVREGETGIAFYVIADGSVEVIKGLGTEHEQVLDTLKQGSFFGEMALFDNHVRSTSVRAAEDTRCLVMTRWDFNAELMHNGHIALAMLSVLARRIRHLNEELTH